MQKDRVSRLCIRISLFAYAVWALLPTVRELSRSYFALGCMVLFAVGLFMDSAYLKKNWRGLLISAVSVAVCIFVCAFPMNRNGSDKKSAIISGVMFYFPIVAVGYLRKKNDPALQRHLGTVMTACIVITSLTTSVLNVTALDGASSRLMAGVAMVEESSHWRLCGLGGYGYIYGLTVTMPLFWLAAERCKTGKGKMLAALFIAEQVVTVFLSEFTFAVMLTALILAFEIFAVLLRRIFRQRISYTASILWGLVPLAVCIVFIIPILKFANTTLENMGFGVITLKLRGVLDYFQNGWSGLGTALREAWLGERESDRIWVYAPSVNSFLQSPLIGSLKDGIVRSGDHSDILDCLSAVGLLGTAVVGGSIARLLSHCTKGAKSIREHVQVGMAIAVLVIVMLINPILLFCEVSLLLTVGFLFFFPVEEAALKVDD